MIGSNKKGSMLLISLYVMVILTGLSAAFMALTANESINVERERKVILAKYAAEAGIERALYDLRQDCVTDINSPDWSDGSINGMSLGPNTSTYYTISGYAGNSINEGSYAVQLKNPSEKTDGIWIKSTGTIGDEVEQIEVYARMYVISPWHNAVFGGAGKLNEVINGNVDIRGSTLLLGASLASSDIAMELGAGSYTVRNNYQGLEATLSVKIPSLDTITFGGESVSSLNANFWVKTGSVSLLGSGTVGEANATGNAYKETLDATFVNNGFSGSQGTSNVYSDNGTSETYPFGSSVIFPSLSDAYVGYLNFQDYVKNNALILAGNLSFSPTDTFNHTDGTNSLTLDGSGNLTISGMIYLSNLGALTFNTDGSNKTFNYTGTGIILAEGEAFLNANIISSGNNSFPTNILGIMTSKRISFNQLNGQFMGLFYSEDEIEMVQSGMVVVGTLAANYFDVTDKAPEIYQVPTAASSVPAGMIGKNASCFIDVISWQ